VTRELKVNRIRIRTAAVILLAAGAGVAIAAAAPASAGQAGQIDLAGLVQSTPQGPGPFDMAVTGGTGRYQDARGYATVVPSQNPKVTVHLTS
jgi:hypothetical protein